MHRKERLDSIMEIMKQYKYVTVKFLTEELHYSSATINRDLNTLANQKLIVRSYGGAELLKAKTIPLIFRYHKMKAEKNRIAKKAAEFICDGDTVFIDGSTTAQYIGQYILNKKDITVITNNIYLASYLSENSVNTVCLGGKIVEPPNMLCGSETVENASHYKADKFFFSTSGIDECGNIVSGELYWLMHRTMAKNSKEQFFLVDHGKNTCDENRIAFTLNEISHFISDFDVADNIKEKFPDTAFIKV